MTKRDGIPLTWYIALVIHSVFCFYIIGDVSFWTYKLWQRRHDFGIVERKKNLIRLFVYSLILLMLARLLHSWVTAFDLFHAAATWAWVLTSATVVFSTAGIFCCCAFVCVRAWLIFFDVSLVVANSDDQWSALITHPVIYRPEIVATFDELDSSLIPAADMTTMEKLFSLRDGESLRKLRAQKSHSDGVESTRLSVSTTEQRRGSRLKSVVSAFSRTNTGRSRGFTLTSVHGPGNPSENWFIRRKISFGNPRWIAFHLRWVIPLVTIIVSVPQCYEPTWDYGRGLFGLIFAFGTFAPAVLAHYFPKFDDTLRMGFELRMCFIVWLVSTLYFLSWAIAALIFSGTAAYNKLGKRRRFEFWSNLLTNTLACFMGRLVCLSQTKFVLLTFPPDPNAKKLRRRRNAKTMNRPRSRGEIRDISMCRTFFSVEWMRQYFDTDISIIMAQMVANLMDVSSLSMGNDRVRDSMKKGSNRSITEEIPHLKPTDLLSDNDGFRKFMKHLFNEFSYESLLCVIELQQFSDSLRAVVNQANDLEFDQNMDPTISGARSPPGLAKANSSILSLIDGVRSKFRLNVEGSGYSSDATDKEDMSTPNNAVLSAVSGSARPKLTSVNTDSASHSSGVGGQSVAHTYESTRVHLPPSIDNVKSTISWDLTMSKEQRFCVLCKKYILMDAEMSVNISFDARQKLIQKSDYYVRGVLPMKVTSAESLEAVRQAVVIDENTFAQVISELIRLMRDSFSRFQRTPEYEELRQRFFEEDRGIKKSESFFF